MLLPITVVCGLDRDAALAAGRMMLRGRPDAQLLIHALDHVDLGLISRTLESGSGTVDSTVVELEHGCVSCTLREDVLPTLRMMSESAALDHAVLVLPPAVEPIGFLESFLFVTDHNGRTASETCRITSVVAVVDPGELIPTLSNHEALADRGLSIGDADDRGVGDVLVAQVECADVLIAVGASACERALLSMLNPEAEMASGVPDIVPTRFDFARTSARTSPAIVDFATDCLVDDAWTVNWCSSRPFHPGRLFQALDEIAEVALRGRGHLRIATRPELPLEWDSVGNRLRLGTPNTGVDPTLGRLSFVGVSDRQYLIVDALRRAELTDAELAAPRSTWRSLDDPFEDIWQEV